MAFTLHYTIKRCPETFQLYVGISLVVLALFITCLAQYLPTYIANSVAQHNIYVRILPINNQNTVINGNKYTIDISRHGLVTLADTSRSPSQSPLVLLENGKPLEPHASDKDIAQDKRGIFQHARPTIRNQEDAYNYERNSRDVVTFVPFTPNIPLSSFQLYTPATAADAWTIRSGTSLVKRIIKYSWYVSGSLIVLGCIMIILNIGTLSHYRYQIPLLAAAAATSYFILAHTLTETQITDPKGSYTYLTSFGLSPDSSTYYPKWDIHSSRLPAYPWFIRIVAPKYDASQILATTPVGVSIDYDHPLKRVSITQILLLFISALFLVFVLMRLYQSPFPILLFMIMFKGHYFIWYELNLILTETLMQALLICGIALSIIFIRNKYCWALLLSSVAFSLAYLTRPAAIFAIVILGFTLLYALRLSWRTYWKTALYALGCYAAVLALPSIHGLLTGAGMPTGASSYQYKICYALRIAHPDDIKLMPGNELKAWLKEALERRNANDVKYDATMGKEPYNRLVYRIQSVYESALTENPHKLSIDEYNTISRIIIKHRLSEYLAFSLTFSKTTLFGSSVDRIKFNFIPSFVIYMVILISAVHLKSATSYFALTLVAAHWTHVFICSLFSAPIARMVWSSDILVIIASGMLLMECCCKYQHKLFTNTQT